MFGGFFNQKKEDMQNQTTVPNPGSAPIPANFPAPSTPPVPTQPTANPVVGSTMQPSQRQDLSILSHLDSRTSQALNQAQQETRRIKQAQIEPEQILFALLYDQEVYKLLQQFSIDVPKLSQEIQMKEQMGSFDGQPMLSDKTKQIFENAYTAGKARGVQFVTPEDLLIALFKDNSNTAIFLTSKGIQKEKIEQSLTKNSSYVYGKKSALETFGIDLTEEAKSGKLDPITGRDREVQRLVHILLRRTKNNPVIIGEAGVGKTAIVEGLAQSIVSGEAPDALKDKKIIQLDLSSLVAGASHRGEFEERLRTVIKETQAAGGMTILFIDEVHTLIGAGDEGGALDASNIIKPFLARGQLQIIGTTTTVEYRKHFEKDKAFERRFQPVLVEEPSEETAVEMLKLLQPKYEKFHNVQFLPDAIEGAVKLSKRYIGERFLPDKAVDLLDESAAEVRLELNSGKRQDNQIKKADIEKVVSSWTGIPITKLTENESEKLLHLEETIHKRLINQEAAVSTVSEAVRRGRIGLSSLNRPIASFIFLGPTGVGKTELAKTLAEIVFGKDDAMIRLDMSEYMEKHEVAKLIGAPPGYVGYEEGGQLTEAVRLKPYSIVLLDEVEKAHPDVFNILLQLLEDGRLTDNKGNTISFKNTIVIATSNIGSALIQHELSGEADTEKQVKTENDPKKKFAELQKTLLNELRKFFKPELINRFDGVVVFEPLSQDHMLQVAKLGIESTRKLLLLQGVDLEITKEAQTKLAKEGYDPVFGARPLRRLIQTAIENPIAVLLINRTFSQGDKIIVDLDPNQEFKFTKAVKTEAPTVPSRPQSQTQIAENQSVSSESGQTGQTIAPPPIPPTSGQTPPFSNGFSNPPTIGQGGTQMAPSDS